MKRYLKVKPESGKDFYLNYHNKGKVVMLNLLKYRAKADYSKLKEIQPKKEVSGEEAYQLYMDNVLPELKKVGSKIIFYGNSESFLIGPEAEKWDAVLLVEHESASKFIAFAQNENYLKYEGHRTAALEDSRLLPVSEKQKYI